MKAKNYGWVLRHKWINECPDKNTSQEYFTWDKQCQREMKLPTKQNLGKFTPQKMPLLLSEN